MRQSLEITTAIGCKNKCLYCPQDTFIKKYNAISEVDKLILVDFKKLLAKIPSDVHLCFAGFSEPWSNPECSKMISYAHQRGYNISVFTTTVGMGNFDIELIKNIPFEEFVIHLPSNAENTKIKVNENYLKIIDELLNYKISNLKFNCQILAINENINKSLKKILNKHGIDLTKILMKPITRAGNIKLKGLREQKRRTEKLEKCMRLDGGLLLPNGDIIICCMDYSLKHVLGNLYNNSFGEIINGKEACLIKRGLKNKKIDILCRYCEHATQYKLRNNPLLEKYIYPHTTPTRKLLNSFYKKLKNNK